MIRTKIGPSKIHGIGLFAAEFISRGTIIWQFQEGFDFALTESDLEKMSPAVLEQVRAYAYIENGRYIICSDDSRFFNHSDKPNCTDVHPLYTIAARNIKKDEELTCNYAVFDDYFALHHTFSVPLPKWATEILNITT